MSFNVLRDNNLDITIALAKRVRENVNGKFVNRVETIQELDLSSIVELEITDSLLHHGLKGRAVLNNKFGALDQLKLLANAADDLFLSIQIIDPELADTNVPAVDRVVSCLAYVGPVAAASANIEDNIVALEFEEAFIAEMKNTSWLKFYANYYLKLIEFSVIDLVRVFSEEISDLYNEKEVFDTFDGLEDFKFDKTLKDTLEYLKDTEEDRGPSVYDIFQKLLERTTTRGDKRTRNSPYHLPLFRFINKASEEGEGEVEVNRKMEITTCFTDRHREFIKEAAEDGLQYESSVRPSGVKGANYYGDVYLEKFTVGPLAQLGGLVDPNTSWHNKIENFNIQRPNVFELKNTDWINYKYYIATAENVGKMESYYVYYARVLNNFAVNELGLNGVASGGVNLPMFNPKTMQAVTVQRNGDFKISGESDQSNRQVVNSLYYKLTRAFITLNETCQFESKGRIYRKPGKFIWIDQNDWSNIADNIAAEGDVSTLLEKLWYVNSVTHKFSNGEYNTSILANRFFGNRTIADINALLDEHKEYVGKEIELAMAEIEKEETKRRVEAAFGSFEALQNTDFLAAPVEQAGPPVAGAGSTATEAEIETVQRTQFSGGGFLPPQ